METDFFMGLAERALWTLSLASAPVLLTALGIGLLFGMVQAATSIQEANLSFVPKLIGVAVAMVLFGGAMMTLVADFTIEIFQMVRELTR